MVSDFTEMDFFRDARLVEDPYPYYEALRQQCPVTREDHHGVTMVTGWDEACAVLNDAETFSSCISVTGPFPGFPVPLEGDDVTELIEQHRDELPFSDQLPTLDPPTHTNHRALLMRLITPKRLKENEDAMWVLADQALDEFLAPGTANSSRASPARSRCWSSPTCWACPWRIATSSSKESASTRVAVSGAPARKRWRTVRWNSSTVFSPTMSGTAALRPATMC